MKKFYLKNKDIINLIITIISIISLTVLINIFKYLYGFINNNINNIIIFSFFLLIVVCYYLFIINRNLKLLIYKEIEIISNEDTYFISSPDYKNIPNNIKSVCTYQHEDWRVNDKNIFLEKI